MSTDYAKLVDPDNADEFVNATSIIKGLMSVLTFGLLLSFGVVAIKKAVTKARAVDKAELGAKTTGESRPPAWVMVQPFGPRDDLQRLEGVDPSLERALNRLGIYHFHQIARFDSSDVEWLVEHADGVPEQTIRDSWIVDASRLAGVQGN